MLLALVAASGAKPSVGVEPYQYYPCEVEEMERGGLMVECPFYNVPKMVRQAFARNAPNKGIHSLRIHSDFDGSLIDYIYDNDLLSGSYDTITEYLTAYSGKTTFPKLLSKLPNLEHLHFDHVGIEHVEAGSLDFASPQSLTLMTISNAPLYTFEAGAFPGIYPKFH